METAQKAISRRAFLGAGFAAGAAVATGRLDVPSWAATRTEPWIEASIPELQALMGAGRLTSRELTLGYLRRIEALNPLLGAVIETNPEAVGDRGAAGQGARRGPRPRPAARDPGAAQGQHRDGRPDGDDRRVARPGGQPGARRCARSWRGCERPAR